MQWSEQHMAKGAFVNSKLSYFLLCGVETSVSKYIAQK